MKKYLEYLPLFMQNMQELKEIGKAEDMVIENLNNDYYGIEKDQWIGTATISGIERREDMMGIAPFHDDTLESRRSRVLANWNNAAPYTFRSYVMWLDQICGEGNYELYTDFDRYSLTIKLEISVKRIFNTVSEISRKMVPANIMLEVLLRYNKHSHFTRTTHREMGGFSHKELKEDIVIG